MRIDRSGQGRPTHAARPSRSAAYRAMIGRDAPGVCPSFVANECIPLQTFKYASAGRPSGHVYESFRCHLDVHKYYFAAWTVWRGPAVLRPCG
ncbi:hypothetical protein EVAR_98965_1 [Eumeta japonica]|uniref:Uncharacterized protein n=1 Tax=Eumeta variegata TaxID=151549 RepID=A0A4C1YRH0_EUMVA|nr:hypothetical protein EVAR_98965_1 [Eumeta japonica]